jgi:hypothetical protein
MKSLEELKELRNKVQKEIKKRDQELLLVWVLVV